MNYLHIKVQKNWVMKMSLQHQTLIINIIKKKIFFNAIELPKI